MCYVFLYATLQLQMKNLKFFILTFISICIWPFLFFFLYLFLFFKCILLLNSEVFLF